MDELDIEYESATAPRTLRWFIQKRWVTNIIIVGSLACYVISLILLMIPFVVHYQHFASQYLTLYPLFVSLFPNLNIVIYCVFIPFYFVFGGLVIRILFTFTLQTHNEMNKILLRLLYVILIIIAIIYVYHLISVFCNILSWMIILIVFIEKRYLQYSQHENRYNKLFYCKDIYQSYILIDNPKFQQLSINLTQLSIDTFELLLQIMFTESRTHRDVGHNYEDTMGSLQRKYISTEFNKEAFYHPFLVMSGFPIAMQDSVSDKLLAKPENDTDLRKKHLLLLLQDCWDQDIVLKLKNNKIINCLYCKPFTTNYNNVVLYTKNNSDNGDLMMSDIHAYVYLNQFRKEWYCIMFRIFLTFICHFCILFGALCFNYYALITKSIKITFEQSYVFNILAIFVFAIGSRCCYHPIYEYYYIKSRCLFTSHAYNACYRIYNCKRTGKYHWFLDQNRHFSRSPTPCKLIENCFMMIVCLYPSMIQEILQTIWHGGDYIDQFTFCSYTNSSCILRHNKHKLALFSIHDIILNHVINRLITIRLILHFGYRFKDIGSFPVEVLNIIMKYLFWDGDMDIDSIICSLIHESFVEYYQKNMVVRQVNQLNGWYDYQDYIQTLDPNKLENFGPSFGRITQRIRDEMKEYETKLSKLKQKIKKRNQNLELIL